MVSYGIICVRPLPLSQQSQVVSWNVMIVSVNLIFKSEVFMASLYAV